MRYTTRQRRDLLKILGFFLLVACSGFLGWHLSGKWKKRKDFYEQWYLFNERFFSDLSYLRLPLTEFLKKYTYKSEFSEFVSAYEKSFQTKTLEIDLRFLSEEEQNAALEYFLALGKSDAASQSVMLRSYQELLEQKKNETATDYEKRSSLYVKLGVLFGLLIMVLFV